MAERIQKIRECDRALCRRRKGVRKVKLTMLVGDEDGIFPSTGQQYEVWGEGELCPFHRVMALNQQDAMFKNTKKYDESEAPEEPLLTLPDDDDDLVKDPDGSVSIR